MVKIMACDLCGKEGKLYRVIVEGSLLNVCERCKEYGNVVEIPEKVEKKKPIKIDDKEESYEIILEDYAQKIKKEREKKGLTQKKLAENLAEKESVIQKLESGQLRPSLVLARKIEQFLGVKLVDIYKEKGMKRGLDFKDPTLTIGDVIDIKK